MYYCSNYVLAILFCVITMLCWGSWGNTQKLAGKTWRYELFYWDYVIGVVLFALVSGLTAGSLGENHAWGFFATLKQASPGNLGSAFLGGVVFNAANLLLAAAISIAGMSVAFPIGIGLALVLGVIVNYVGAPKGDALTLFGGVALIVVAILCNAFAYKIKQAHDSQQSHNLLKGVILSVVCGTLMAFFYRFIACTMDMDFTKAAPAAGMMSPYSAFFVFSLGILASTFVFNAIAMRHPVAGEPITEAAYFKGTFGVHLVGVLGGLIWGLGNGINLVAAGKAGAAISYGLGQGATLVSALWGILIWKEFRGAPRKAGILNLAMFVIFLLGLGLIIAAGTDEKKGTAASEPVRIIFDTDMITDFDDVGALACLHALADAGECQILATVSCTRGNASVGAVQVINSYYGRKDIPVGCAKGIGVLGAAAGAKTKVDPKAPLGSRGGGDGGHYKYRKLLADYPGWYTYADSDEAPDANEVYRKALAESPDHSVVICSVGFLTNLRRLLETKGDQYSPLDGKALVAQKVKKWVAMACAYPRGREYNSMWDAESSRIVLENWPTPVVVSDFQYGCDLFAGRAIAEMKGPRNPVKDVFAGNIPSRAEIAKDPARWQRDCFGLGGRSAWDETAVLTAVRGEQSYFNVHRGTYRMVGDKGDDEWVPDEAQGPHIRITEKLNKLEVGKIIDELICRPPLSVRRHP